MKALALLAMVGGCPAPHTPAAELRSLRLVIVGDAPRADYLQGARTWEQLGFVASFADSGRTECARRWYEDSPTCQITIGIVRDPTLRQRAGTNALTDRETRTVRIDSSVTERYQLLTAVAHEIGHIVLDTPLHTKGGVMGGADFALHDVDLDLACAQVHVCLGGRK